MVHFRLYWLIITPKIPRFHSSFLPPILGLFVAVSAISWIVEMPNLGVSTNLGIPMNSYPCMTFQYRCLHVVMFFFVQSSSFLSFFPIIRTSLELIPGLNENFGVPYLFFLWVNLAPSVEIWLNRTVKKQFCEPNYKTMLNKQSKTDDN